MPKKKQDGGVRANVTFDAIAQIEKYGAKAIGRDALIRHLKGEPLRQKETIHAMCYNCTGYYADGTDPCEIMTCPLQPMMPYRIGGVRKLRTVAPGTKIGKHISTEETADLPL